MPVKINVTSNTKNVLAQIQADQRQIGRAQIQALNRTADKVRGEAGKEVRSVYNIKLKAVRASSAVRRAGRHQQFPTAIVSFSGRPIPLTEFDPKLKTVMTARGPRQAVSVRILRRGTRKTVSRGFMATIKSGALAGKTGIFQRQGAARYPIKYAQSVSIPQALASKAVTQAIIRVADSEYDKQFRQALRFQLSRG